MKGYKRIEWIKGKADRNEALDLQVYNLAMAYYLGLHRYGEQDWEKLRQALAQANLFEEPTPAKPPAFEQEDDDADAEVEPQSPAQPPARPAPTAMPTPPRPAPQPMQRRSSSSGYLKRR